MFEGDIIVPEFVLKELQKIADSGDSMTVSYTHLAGVHNHH